MTSRKAGYSVANSLQAQKPIILLA